MATVSVGKIVIIVIFIFFIVIAIFLGTSVVAGIGVNSPDSLCKWNAAMNSVTPLHAWKLAPNFACHARAVVLDAEGKTTVFENELGNVEECSCNQFYGPLIDFAPALTIDGDLFTYSRIPVEDNRSEISLYVYDQTELGDLEINFERPVTANYTIYTREKRFFWTDYEKCVDGTLSSDLSLHEADLDDLDCTVDETEGSAIKVVLSNIDRSTLPIDVQEIQLEDISSDTIPIKRIFFKYHAINEQQDKCIADSNVLGIKGCTPRWQMKWVAKRLSELAMRCWQMGGRGGYFGDFDCFVGCVYYDSDASEEIFYTTIEQALAENYFRSSVEDEYVPYKNLLTIEDMAIETRDSLEDGKCFYMKYYRGAQLSFALPGIFDILVIPEKEPRIILTFGRTIEEARRDL